MRRAGQVDMTQALRSPGSTLKPFIYGLGFEDGFIHPETLIDDRPARYGGYAPQNFDFTFQGTVTVRKALQLSLNLPALAVLDQVGASRLTARLTQAGATLVLPEGEAPGLAIGLGGVGIRLSDLVMLYAGIARLGTVAAARASVCRRGDGAGAAARWSRSRPGTSATSLSARRRRRTALPRPHRVQDRHQLRLPRRLVDRLRRQAHHRRLGRPARWRAGAGSGRTHGGGADPVRRLRAPADAAGAVAAARRQAC